MGDKWGNISRKTIKFKIKLIELERVTVRTTNKYDMYLTSNYTITLLKVSNLLCYKSSQQQMFSKNSHRCCTTKCKQTNACAVRPITDYEAPPPPPYILCAEFARPASWVGY